jgi:phosphoglycolate phosphatase-like HAD superfamily hydrolase
VLLVLWDIDGTLVDSAGHGRRAFEDAYRAVVGGEPIQVAMAGRTDRQIALAMLDESDGHLPRLLEELVTALERREQAIRREGRALPGVEAALERLAAREGVLQSLLTGNLAANAAVKLGAFGLERFLDLEVGGYGSDPHEARSDLVAVARERACMKYAVTGERPGAAGGRGGREPPDAIATVLVGDTPLDVRAAHEAGARAVAVASGPYGADELAAAGADAVLADLRDTERVLAAVTDAT